MEDRQNKEEKQQNIAKQTMQIHHRYISTIQMNEYGGTLCILRPRYMHKETMFITNSSKTHPHMVPRQAILLIFLYSADKAPAA